MSYLYTKIFTDKIDIAYVNVALTVEILSSNEQPPAIKLKSIHANLKYAFLTLDEIFHIIVSSKLESE